jgi:phage shock protein A
LRNLVRGVLAQWLGRREQSNPGAVYEAAIQERIEQYARLRQAAAGVLYMRNKLSKELDVKTIELRRVGAQLDLAIDRDDDDVALALINRRDWLTAEVERVTAELADLTSEAEDAKKNLIGFQTEIERLREEKVRMLARLANAKARLRLQETLAGLSPDADIRALESVREHVQRIVEEARLNRDVRNGDLERRLGKIRADEAEVAARQQLDELKRSRRVNIAIPLLEQPVAVSGRAL